MDGHRLALVHPGLACLFYLSFAATNRGDDRRGEESALEILKRRYARGEISKEQYEKMRQEFV